MRKTKKKAETVSLSRRLAKVERRLASLEAEVITRSRLRQAWERAAKKAGLDLNLGG